MKSQVVAPRTLSASRAASVTALMDLLVALSLWPSWSRVASLCAKLSLSARCDFLWRWWRGGARQCRLSLHFNVRLAKKNSAVLCSKKERALTVISASPREQLAQTRVANHSARGLGWRLASISRQLLRCCQSALCAQAVGCSVVCFSPKKFLLLPLQLQLEVLFCCLFCILVLGCCGFNAPVSCFQGSFLRQRFSCPALSGLSFLASLLFQRPLTQALL